MRRLVASGLLPERAGQPVKVWAHVSLAELRALDDGSVLAQEWIGEMAVRWAARRAAAAQAGSDGAAWLDGKPARAMACDAAVIPVVTGGIDPGALDDLVALCLTYAGHGPHCGAAAGHAEDPDSARPARGPAGGQPARRATPGPRTRGRRRVGRPAPRRARGRPPPRRRRCSATRSSARPSTWSPAPAGSRRFLRTRLAGRPAGRAQPAAGRRAQRPDPRRDPPRGHPARPALPLGRRLRPARLRLRSPPRHPPGRRRHHQRRRVRPVLLFPSPRRDPPVGLDRRPAPRRHHHRPQPRRHEDPAKSRAAVIHRSGHPRPVQVAPCRSRPASNAATVWSDDRGRTPSEQLPVTIA